LNPVTQTFFRTDLSSIHLSRRMKEKNISPSKVDPPYSYLFHAYLVESELTAGNRDDVRRLTSVEPVVHWDVVNHELQMSATQGLKLHAEIDRRIVLALI
jgi:hypothetical protein